MCSRQSGFFPSFHSRSPLALLGFLCLLALSGCREQAPWANSNPVAEVAPPAPQPSTSSLSPDQTVNNLSPAMAELAVNDMDPEAVCKKFLESLQSGNRIAAENLLTRTALQVTAKAGLVLEPLGGVDSRFEFLQPRFATIKNEIAYVDCVITEVEEGIENSFTVSWVVKKQNNAWKISGLLMELDEDRPMKLVSFENIHDVEDIKLRAAETLVDSALPDEQTRQANLPVSDESATRK
jgi:hypothetical protein